MYEPFVIAYNARVTFIVITLALGSRPRQGLARV